MVKAGGGDIDDASEKLRHSTLVLTVDTYMELFEGYEDELTGAAAAGGWRARRAADGTSAHASRTQGPGSDESTKPETL